MTTQTEESNLVSHARTELGRAEDYARINGRDFDPAPNLLPAIIGGEAAAGHIKAVGHAQCTRPSRRAGWMRVWRAAS